MTKTALDRYPEVSVKVIKVAFGRTEWRNEQGRLHREDGPAIVWPDGTLEWYYNGYPHRVDGPAATTENGYSAWFTDGCLHRINGPAKTWQDGEKEWWVDDVRIKIY